MTALPWWQAIPIVLAGTLAAVGWGYGQIWLATNAHEAPALREEVRQEQARVREGARSAALLREERDALAARLRWLTQAGRAGPARCRDWIALDDAFWWVGQGPGP